MEKVIEVGGHVVYTDEHSKPHNALITHVWGTNCCNLLFVVDAEDKNDPYGRQIERRSSCCHGSIQQAPGNFWRFPNE